MQSTGDDHQASPSPNPRPSPGPGPSVEEWEQVRRSVAMLPPNSWAMRREQALGLLETLIGQLRRSTG